MTDSAPVDANHNLDLWRQLSPVDRSFTKPITGKSYKGDSPNPTYVIKKLTAAFGPIGDKWGFEVKFDRVRQGKPIPLPVYKREEFGPPREDGTQPIITREVRWEIIREENHEVCITFWFLNEDGHIRKFDAFGGTPMFYQSKSGNWILDEDAAKKSFTDAYTKGASWLGACADIFMGLFDDKDTSQPDSGTPPPAPRQPPAAPPPAGDAFPPAAPPPALPAGARTTDDPFN